MSSIITETKSARNAASKSAFKALAAVHAALGYYYDHREEIDAELAAEVSALDVADERAPSALRLRLVAARRAATA